MISKRQSFQSTLRKNVPNIVGISSQKNLRELFILKKLGLDNLPEDIEVSLSPDNTCINIKLKDTPKEKHLLFQIPLEGNDLSALNNHPQKNDLFKRYQRYAETYRPQIIENAKNERTFLQKVFPNLIFNQKIRLKSEPSYQEKLNKDITDGKTPFVDDIIAERIIISEYNGAKNPEDLKKACYLVAEALAYFRTNTNFQKKDLDLSNNPYKSDKPYISKDYIKKEKEHSKYQSLHVTIENQFNPDLVYELQIRTFDMEEKAKKSETQAHFAYKPRFLNDLSPLRLPKYTEVTHFIDQETGKCIAFNLSVEDCFYNYYSLVSLRNNGCPISYAKYNQELTELQKYINFEDIRNKAKELHINKEKNRDDG